MLAYKLNATLIIQIITIESYQVTLIHNITIGPLCFQTHVTVESKDTTSRLIFHGTS